MEPHSCTRCGVNLSQENLDAGEGTLIDDQPYCDPCSDVMFGMLDPAQAPQPLNSEGSSQEESGFGLENYGQAPLVDVDENYDTSEVSGLDEADFEDVSPLQEEDMLDTGAATVSVDVEEFEGSDFEEVELMDVDLDGLENSDLESTDSNTVEDLPEKVSTISDTSEEPLVVDDAANEFADSADTVTDDVDLEGFDEESAFQNSEEETEVDLDNDLPDYLEADVDFETDAPILEETLEDESNQEKKKKKKDRILEAKKVKAPHTKKGKKAKTLSPEEKEKRAEQKKVRMEQMKIKAEKKKKTLTLMLVVSIVVILGAGGAIFFKSQAPVKKERAVNFDTDPELLAMYTELETALSDWEKSSKDEFSVRVQRAQEVKNIYFNTRNHVMQWSDDLEERGMLTDRITAHLGKRMQRYQEQYRQIQSFLKSANNK